MKHIEAQDPAFFRWRRQITFRFLLVSASGLALVGVTDAPWSILVAGGALAGLLLWSIADRYHQLQIDGFHHYRQLAALQNLHALLDLNAPLPPMRLWAASPDFAVQVLAQVRANAPSRVVELGSGTSTLIVSYTLEALGKGWLISFDHAAQFAQGTQQLLDQHGLSQWAEIRVADLQTQDGLTWYTAEAFQDVQDIDLLIVDGPPNLDASDARYPTIPRLYDRLKVGALILVDDYLRDVETVDRWLTEYPGLILVETLLTEKGTALLRKTAR